jgi:hypothetical protein
LSVLSLIYLISETDIRFFQVSWTPDYLCQSKGELFYLHNAEGRTCIECICAKIQKNTRRSCNILYLFWPILHILQESSLKKNIFSILLYPFHSDSILGLDVCHRYPHIQLIKFYSILSVNLYILHVLCSIQKIRNIFLY